MATTAALILTDGLGGLDPVTPGAGNTVLAGLTLTEHAVLAAHRTGIDRVQIVGDGVPDAAVLARLHAPGLSITCTPTRHRPFAAVPPNTFLVVLPVVTLVEPPAIAALITLVRLGAGEAALVVDPRADAWHRPVLVVDGRVRALMTDGNAAATGLALLTPDAVEMVRDAPSAWAAFRRLARATTLWTVGVEPWFCRRLYDERDRARLEREYLLRHSNGGDKENVFRKQIRRFGLIVHRVLVSPARWRAASAGGATSHA